MDVDGGTYSCRDFLLFPAVLLGELSYHIDCCDMVFCGPSGFKNKPFILDDRKSLLVSCIEIQFAKRDTGLAHIDLDVVGDDLCIGDDVHSGGSGVVLDGHGTACCDCRRVREHLDEVDVGLLACGVQAHIGVGRDVGVLYGHFRIVLDLLDEDRSSGSI